jgi:alanine or glycine:cation symporter, AGCS family
VTSIAGLLSWLNSTIWDPWMLVLLFGTHLFLTFRLRGIQRYTFKAIRLSLQRKREGAGEISQFGALMTALAATIGTGNIVGVATAVAAGGPGAVLWMWLTGVFGIATKYSEAVLAVKYRVISPDGKASGGPMYALERGLGVRWLGIVFAIFTAIAAFGIGNMVQANSISAMLNEPAHLPQWLSSLLPHWTMGAGGEFHIPTWLSGIVMTILTAVVILGGIRSIARVCEFLVPFMAIFYVLGCLIILGIRYATVPDTIMTILHGAFTPQAAVGGFIGAGVMQAMRFGMARGLFSNESGLGSAPIVAAAAQTKNPIRQALVSSTGTFWDTVVVCLMTGLVVVDSGKWQEGLKGAALTKAAFSILPYVGPTILAVGLLTFVFSTILGWSYYGEKACEYLFGPRSILPYRTLWVMAVMVGSVLKLQMVWDFADIANAMMAVPNLIVLMALSGVVVAETRKYLWENRLDESAPPEPGSIPPRGFPVEPDRQI